MATKKKQAKTRRTSTARSAAKARAKKAKPGAKKKKAAVKKSAAKKTAKAKKKPAAKKTVAKKRAAKKGAVKRAAPARKPAAKARAPQKPAAAKAARPAAAPPATRMEHDLRDEIEVTLYRRGVDGVPALVDVLSAVARGYKSGPAAPPPGVVIDVNTPIADAIVERYEQGGRDPDRRSHRPQVLATVGFNLDQLGLGETSEDVRQVLTTLCLGSWNPQTGSHAELDGVASFVVRFYRDGR